MGRPQRPRQEVPLDASGAEGGCRRPRRWAGRDARVLALARAWPALARVSVSHTGGWRRKHRQHPTHAPRPDGRRDARRGARGARRRHDAATARPEQPRHARPKTAGPEARGEGGGPAGARIWSDLSGHVKRYLLMHPAPRAAAAALGEGSALLPICVLARTCSCSYIGANAMFLSVISRNNV